MPLPLTSRDPPARTSMDKHTIDAAREDGVFLRVTTRQRDRLMEEERRHERSIAQALHVHNSRGKRRNVRKHRDG